MTLVKAGDGITDMRGSFGGVYFHRDKSGLHSSSMPRKVHRRSAAQKLQRDAFVAARSLSTDNRIVSYLMYRYLNGLPLNYPDAWINPCGYIDPDGKWTNEPFAIDGNAATRAESVSIAGGGWQSSLEVTNCVPLTCTNIRYRARYSLGNIDEIRIRIFYSGSYHTIYEGIFANFALTEVPFAVQTVSKAELSFKTTFSPITQRIATVEFYCLNNPINNEPHYPVPVDYQIPHLQGP